MRKRRNSTHNFTLVWISLHNRLPHWKLCRVHLHHIDVHWTTFVYTIHCTYPCQNGSPTCNISTWSEFFFTSVPSKSRSFERSMIVRSNASTLFDFRNKLLGRLGVSCKISARSVAMAETFVELSSPPAACWWASWPKWNRVRFSSLEMEKFCRASTRTSAFGCVHHRFDV